jgi:hypothetical protein
MHACSPRALYAGRDTRSPCIVIVHGCSVQTPFVRVLRVAPVLAPTPSITVFPCRPRTPTRRSASSLSRVPPQRRASPFCSAVQLVQMWQRVLCCESPNLCPPSLPGPRPQATDATEQPATPMNDMAGPWTAESDREQSIHFFKIYLQPTKYHHRRWFQ